ncbi:Bug family tripartite tricarboxylate transporter substrate binding protein [Caenimonas soli]|uniref:Bug family tripartite tricarboxylate transporter substrate binding protein n=1 Tax=Caenimonas soli TaxID=2735555 RepID=UPI001555E3BF|nr:tripartite tricarboxylate transporter substrate-binding protein [Caenimonas soli]NPC59135.1 tripartite tricarboxylate transporter substrate binding protein [Caenimonas soli]
MIRKLFAVLVAFAAVSAGVANADDWPTKAVKIVVPFPAGGATDVPARLLADRLSKIWRQPVIVENRPGAGGALGAAEVARAAADGYTLLFPSGSVMTVNQFVYAKLPYDPVRDFSPITNVASSPQVLVVPKQSRFETMEALIAHARSNPSKLTFAHAGVGSQSHLANEYFLQQAKIQAVGVPYKGDPPAVTDIIGGNIDFSVISLGASLANVKGGKLRALGVTSREEIAQLPGVRPIGAVLTGFENTGWFGLVAPANVPPTIVKKIYQDALASLSDADLRAQLDAMGFRIVANSPEAMAEAMASERKRWAQIVLERKIRQD